MQENKLFEALLDVIPFAAYAVDIDTYEVVYANRLMTETMYAPREEYCWKKIFGQEEVCSWCKISELKQRQAIYKSEKLISNFFDESTDKWLQSYDELVKWPDGRTVKYSIAVDITAQKEIQADMIKTHTKLAMQKKKLKEVNSKLEELNKKDNLTGVNNRDTFFILGEKLLENSRNNQHSLYAAIFDIDKLKDINIKYSKIAGDTVIKDCIKTIENLLDIDEVFGRLTGVEFGVLMPNKTDIEVNKKLELIRETIEGLSIDLEDGKSISSTISIAFDKLQDDDTELQTLLSRIDIELLNIKDSGGNTVKQRGV